MRSLLRPTGAMNAQVMAELAQRVAPTRTTRLAGLDVGQARKGFTYQFASQ